MRYNVGLNLEKENIPKDKNRIILSFLKHIYESYDKEYYKSLFEEVENKRKSYTFSLYMPNCRFTRDEIIIPGKKILLNFSTPDMKDGILFYNSVVTNKEEPYTIKGNSITIQRINMNKEKPITDNSAVFSTMSPIVVRRHEGDNKNTWYHTLEEKIGREIFMKNLEYQLIDNFGEERRLDIEEIEFQLLNNKTVKVKHYGIEILSNICRLKIQAKPYLLDYIYKAGLGSNRSVGFGMVDLV